MLAHWQATCLQLHDGAQKIEKYIPVHQGLIIATYNIKIYVLKNAPLVAHRLILFIERTQTQWLKKNYLTLYP